MSVSAEVPKRPSGADRAGLTMAEIRRRVRGLYEAASEAGFSVGAIRMSASGEISLVDKSLLPSEESADDLNGFI